MKYTIEHEIPGRIRITVGGFIPDGDMFAFEELFSQSEDVTSYVIYQRIGSIAFRYGSKRIRSMEVLDADREALIAYLDTLDIKTVIAHRPTYTTAMVPHTNQLLGTLAGMVLGRIITRYFLPVPLRTAWIFFRALSFIRAGLRSLAAGRLDVPVLDAAAVGVSLVKKDYMTASSTMFLLTLGGFLEDYTRQRSKNELIYSLLDVPDSVWRIEGDQEVLVCAGDLETGDIIVVRTGSPLPADGVVIDGEAAVNQSTLTGESLSVIRNAGDDVFAGTAIEEGELVVRVSAPVADARLRSIVSLVEQSESFKSVSQSHTDRLADRIVPWNFLLAGIVFACTRDLEKASAALMVDYSCALKLSGSIAVLTAMSEGAHNGFTVKGSRYFEVMAEADTIVFDKTGTLTTATPVVSNVLAFDGWDRDGVLRLAACLEEHFPHSVARAVVNAAAAAKLNHRERHAAVEYLVAHGIVSELEDKRVIIGSGHFVFEDEGVPIDDDLRKEIDRKVGDASPLFLAVDHLLVGAICIQDPLRPNIAATLQDLRDLGFKRLIMLTGDNKTTAARIAEEAGITEFEADLLPEQKHAYLEKLKADGCKVVMVGDGINDSPALSVADVGIAMGEGAAIAREVADITLASGELSAVADLRRLSSRLFKRMGDSYRFVIALNTALLALGISGVMLPQTSSLMHNGSTVLVSLNNARPYLKKG